MLISDKVFRASLDCETKAFLLLSGEQIVSPLGVAKIE